MFDALEKFAPGGGAAIATLQKVSRNFDGISESKKLVPEAGFAGEDNVAGLFVFVDEDFLTIETKCRGKTDSLTAAILEEFCGSAHGRLLCVQNAWHIP